MAANQFIHFLPPQNPQPKLPLFVYLPGMDGTGKLLRSQIPSLERSFDIRRLSIPVDDLSNWDEMVVKIAELIKGELATEYPKRQLYLCGESFGGCLALKLTIEFPELCNRLILVNPASSFKQQAWIRWGLYFTPLLPARLYPLSCMALLPLLATLERIAVRDSNALLNVMQSVKFKSAMWRVSLLDRFDVEIQQLEKITQPTLVISSGSDRLLPSKVEGKLLTQNIPGSQLYLIPDGGHAVLLERMIDLHEILRTCGFLPSNQVNQSSTDLTEYSI
ncbi:MAG: alpha/beta hydrolase [Alkalinema sp. CAN_BIN05]|nr:alpha/beta hydrolase [Alkalinema sp. CAN_BIN05]